MRNIILSAGIFIIASIFSSCQDFTEEILDAPAKSTLDESVIFSTPGLARGAIDGILEPMGQTNSYRGRFIPFYGFNTDTEWNHRSDQLNDAQADLMVYNTQSNNSQMNSTNNAWAMMYSGIERANICIRGLRNYGDPEPGTELGQLLGEALTLRAIYYTDLTKAWGDIPARFEPINSETIYIEKSSRDVIFKQIIQDLGEAAELVAWPNASSATTSTENINKAFIKGLRARLALIASGYQQYPDGVRRSDDPELSVSAMYKLALDECRDIIKSGTVRLEPTFESLWRNYNEEDISAGRESLWEIPFSDGRGRVLFSFAIRHRGVDQFTGQPRGGIAGPLPTVFYDYDESDTRRDITCIPYWWGSPVDGIAQQELGSLDTWYFGKYRYEWMNRYVTSTNDDGVNKIFMRYAEVLLMAAETANELEGPGAAAPYLKAIRKRAFAPEDQSEKVDAYINSLSSKQDMFDAIVDEHKFEFTGEMERKRALIRWNMLGANLEMAKSKLADLKNRSGEYSDVPTKLYYKYKEDGISLDVYGLNRGETDNPGPEYSEKSWDSLTDDKVNSLYLNNPDSKQFWPIWQVFIDGSNGKLYNDYGY